MVEKHDVTSAPSDWWSHLYEPMRQFGSRVAEFFSPSSDAATTDDYYEINVELPGVAEDDIKIEVHDDRLTITGEKRIEREDTGKSYYFSERVYGKFQRAFRLPVDADQEKIVANHKDGLLTVKIAKVKETVRQPRQIDITRS